MLIEPLSSARAAVSGSGWPKPWSTLAPLAQVRALLYHSRASTFADDNRGALAHTARLPNPCFNYLSFYRNWPKGLLVPCNVTSRHFQASAFRHEEKVCTSPSFTLDHTRQLVQDVPSGPITFLRAIARVKTKENGTPLLELAQLPPHRPAGSQLRSQSDYAPLMISPKSIQIEERREKPLLARISSNMAKTKEDKRKRARELGGVAGEVSWSELLHMLEQHTPQIDSSTIASGSKELLLSNAPALRRAARKHTPSSAIPWNAETFKEHIYSITNDSKHLKKRNQSVEKKIETLFNDENTKRAITLPAVHNAFTYLLRRRRRKEAFDVLYKMEAVGMATTTETWNINLWECAKQQHLMAFRRTLKRMIDRGLKPDAETWAALIAAAPDDDFKQAAALKMAEKGLLSTSSSCRKIAGQIIESSVGAHLDTEQDVFEYIETLDNLFNYRWVSNGNVHRIAGALLERGRVFDAIMLFKTLAQERYYLPDTADLNFLLSHCAHQRDADAAVLLCTYWRQRWRTEPDETTMYYLFRTAVSSFTYNLVRTVWKFACSKGMASTWMKRWVLSGLHLELPTSSSSVLLRFKANAAAVACGTDAASADHDSLRRIFRRDMGRSKYAQHFQPRYTDMLVEALAVDKDWTSRGIKRTTNLEWMITNAVQVPFETRDGHLPTVVRRTPTSTPPGFSTSLKAGIAPKPRRRQQLNKRIRKVQADGSIREKYSRTPAFRRAPPVNACVEESMEDHTEEKS